VWVSQSRSLVPREAKSPRRAAQPRWCLPPRTARRGPQSRNTVLGSASAATSGTILPGSRRGAGRRGRRSDLVRPGPEDGGVAAARSFAVRSGRGCRSTPFPRSRFVGCRRSPPTCGQEEGTFDVAGGLAAVAGVVVSEAANTIRPAAVAGLGGCVHLLGGRVAPWLASSAPRRWSTHRSRSEGG